MVVAACQGDTAGSTTDVDSTGSPFFDGQVATLSINGEELLVAVADSSGERSEGLKGVEDLGDLDGMLFVFERPRVVAFGMSDTLIPLDVWFIDSSGVIFGSAAMEPCPAEPCVDYVSPGDAAQAIETPAGVYAFPMGASVSTVGSD